MTQTFDLVLRGGRVIDPAQGIDAISDVAVANGRIAAVQPGLPESGQRSLTSGKPSSRRMSLMICNTRSR
jgi:predicted amidohydrolase